MTEPVNINDKRKPPKEAKCDLCGSKEHEGALSCPRIASVTYWPDGCVTAELIEQPPVAG
jgi:hypothetical protein